MDRKELICIGCPMGCHLTVTMKDGAVDTVTGNTCKRGDVYARKELTHPTRIVTSTVRLKNRPRQMVSVKTKTDIPKEKIGDCILALKAVEVTPPVRIGQIILENAAGTGVPVVATKNVD